MTTSTSAILDTPPASSHFAEEICQGLDAAWQMLRMIEAGIPDAVIFPHFSQAKWNMVTMGHFAPSLWRRADEEHPRHQVGINPLTFATPEEALLVLLHEAAHGILWENGQHGGCSQNGVYHDTAFRNECARLGLRVEFDGTRRGWNKTQWGDAGIPARYRQLLALLQDQLQDTFCLMERVPAGAGSPLPQAGRVPLQCSCGRSIYVGRLTAKHGGIQCLFCKTPFVVQAGKPLPDAVVPRDVDAR